MKGVRQGITRATICSLDVSYRFPVIDKWRESYEPDPEEIVEHVFVAEVDGGDPTLSHDHDA